MRVLVTGATGNVGTALLRRLAREPGLREVIGVVRRPPAPAHPPYDLARWVGLDVGARSARDQLGRLARGCDAVVHAAFVLQPAHDQRLSRHANIDGSANVMAAVVDAGVPHVVQLSSAAVYAPSTAMVDEQWVRTGIPRSSYSRAKVAVERDLDALEQRHGQLSLARLRPVLIVQEDAASELAGYFLGPWLGRLPGSRLPVPWMPLSADMGLQVVHADDVAEAIVRAIQGGHRGAFNLAADPPLSASTAARAFGARRIPVPSAVPRAAAWLAWRTRLAPTEPGWLELLRKTPFVRTNRARTVLGWVARHDAEPTLRSFAAAAKARRAGTSPALASSAAGGIGPLQQ